MKKMKVLHVGYGFTPWRGGGLINYAEDIMREQVKHGYEVFYFCSGRHYPLFRFPWLKRWNRDKYTIFEVINPPIYHGGDRGTIFDLESSEIEQFFTKVVDEIKPDIIHIQELAGLPSSLIDIIVSRKIPSIMTLQDYFLLCPTLKLFDSNYQNCLDFENGKKCVICCSRVNENLLLLMMNTFLYHLRKYKVYRLVKYLYLYKNFLKEILNKFENIKGKNKNIVENRKIHFSLSEFFSLRRTKNIERLKKIDLLIAQSHKVAKIYKNFLGLDEKSGKIITLHLTVKHVESIIPRIIDKIQFPINFGTLNGCTSISKGAYFMLETIKILNKKGLDKYFKLHIFGGLFDGIKAEILSFSNVVYRGPYKVSEINKLLENIDVGIIPSVWEEAYGYVGIEFLAKGIPVIGNNIGGIPDYTIDNFTGFVNYDNSPEGMANTIERVISEPNIIKILNAKILEHRNKIIKTMEQHFYELDTIYKDLIKKTIK